MHVVTIIGLFLLGGVFASFIMCYADRYLVKTIHGRSVCDQCGSVLTYKALIPFIGGIFGCKVCGARGGGSYVLFEIAYSAIFVSIVYFFLFSPWSLGVAVFHQVLLAGISALMLSLYSFLALIDLKHYVFPTSTLIFTIFVSVLFFGLVVFVQTSLGQDIVSWEIIKEVLKNRIWYLCIGFLWAAPFLLISAFSKERLMGYGDGILMMSFGIVAAAALLLIKFWNLSELLNAHEFFGAYFFELMGKLYLATLLSASLIGIAWGVMVNYIATKKLEVKRYQAIPFGPPLIVAFISILMLI